MKDIRSFFGGATAKPAGTTPDAVKREAPVGGKSPGKASPSGAVRKRARVAAAAAGGGDSPAGAAPGAKPAATGMGVRDAAAPGPAEAEWVLSSDDEVLAPREASDHGNARPAVTGSFGMVRKGPRKTAAGVVAGKKRAGGSPTSPRAADLDGDAGGVEREEMGRASAAGGVAADGGPAAASTPRPAKRSAPPADTTSGRAAKTAARPTAAKKQPAPALPASSLEAIAKVAQAERELPDESELDLTFLPEAAYVARPVDDPPNRGKVPEPRGHPDCLTGRTFVISGVLDSLTRPMAEDVIRRHNGKVTGSISGKTSFLLVGRSAGRGKYGAAAARGTKLIDEAGLRRLIAAAPAPEDAGEPGAAAAGSLPLTAAAPPAAAPAPAPAAAPATTVSVARAPAAGPTPPVPRATFSRPPSGTGAGEAPRAGDPRESSLWVEKWRPRTTTELIGNNSLVQTLRQWLETWDNVHLRGFDPPQAASARKGAGDLKKRAVLISGPPGIGKTSAALAVCHDLGITAVEVNASDSRAKSDSSVLKGIGGKLSNTIKEMATNSALPGVAGGSAAGAGGTRPHTCLIMDEVDGMSGGDRGGVTDLIATIKVTKHPIVAICNDRYSQKLKSLRNHCLELEFRKPTAPQIVRRLSEICRAEGLEASEQTLTALVATGGGGDVRQLVGQLQMARRRAGRMSYDQAKSLVAKDIEVSPFESARILLGYEADQLDFGRQLDAVFQDADLVPLLVQENYLNHRPRVAKNDAGRLAALAKAADSISLGDVVSRRIRARQEWGLAPLGAALGAVIPATYARGPRETFGIFPGEPNFPRFTAWLGNNSTQGKQRRLLGELHARASELGASSAGRTALRLDVAPALRDAALAPVLARGKEGVPDSVSVLLDYNLVREDLDFLLDVSRFKSKAPWAADPTKRLDAATKSALTRACTAEGARLEDANARKGLGGAKKRRGASASGDASASSFDAIPSSMLEEGEEPGADDDEPEDEQLDPSQVQKRLGALRHVGVSVELAAGGTATAAGRGRGRGSGGRGGRGSGGRGGRGSGGAASKKTASGRGRGAGKRTDQ